MVRTKDSASVKVAGAKAPRKITPASTSSESCSEAKKKYSGGNPYFPRETPAWQKPITSFFTSPTSSDTGSTSATAVDNDSEAKPTATVDNDCEAKPNATVNNDSEEKPDEPNVVESDVSGTNPQKAESNGDTKGGVAVNTKEDGDDHEPS